MFLLNKKKYIPLVQNWIIILILLVMSMIVIGGLTRLTDSGLSITEWELFNGLLPPLNDREWDIYFSKYQKIPQYLILNQSMTMGEFKIIFFWEYIHRLLGRLTGIIFLLPLIFFIYKKALSKILSFRLIVIFLLVVSQGILGWYMVRSGLVNNITVSHYRLASHLLMAFIILSSLFWLLLNLHYKLDKVFFNIRSSFLSLKFFILLIFIQIIFGAFVSGLDAGRIYQTWPLMNESFFPDDIDIKIISDLFIFSSHSLIQFFHRNIAYAIFIIYLFVGYEIFKARVVRLYRSYVIVFIFIFLQILLGIYTLLSGLNILIALSHQISSIFLILFSLNLYHQSIE